MTRAWFTVKPCPDPRCGASPEEPHVWRDPEDNRLKSCAGHEDAPATEAP